MELTWVRTKTTQSSGATVNELCVIPPYRLRPGLRHHRLEAAVTAEHPSPPPAWGEEVEAEICRDFEAASGPKGSLLPKPALLWTESEFHPQVRAWAGGSPPRSQ